MRACSLAEVGEDIPVHVDIGERPVCMVRTGGAVYALRDECTHESVADQVLLAAVSVPAALSLVLMASWKYASLILNRCRMAAWDADWSVTEPQWTGRG